MAHACAGTATACDLETDTERRIYELLAKRLPRSAVISVVHRAALEAYHSRHWWVAPRPHAPAALEAA